MIIFRHSKEQLPDNRRHSNRKRKANRYHPTSLASEAGNRARECCLVTETLLGVTTEAVMIGLTDGELQLEIAQWATSVAETGKKRHCSCIDCCVCVFCRIGISSASTTDKVDVPTHRGFR